MSGMDCLFQWLRLARHAVLDTFINLLWFFGLTQCGPFRLVPLYYLLLLSYHQALSACSYILKICPLQKCGH